MSEASSPQSPPPPAPSGGGKPAGAEKKLVAGILYLTKSDEEFVATYIEGRKPWF